MVRESFQYAAILLVNIYWFHLKIKFPVVLFKYVNGKIPIVAAISKDYLRLLMSVTDPPRPRHIPREIDVGIIEDVFSSMRRLYRKVRTLHSLWQTSENLLQLSKLSVRNPVESLSLLINGSDVTCPSKMFVEWPTGPAFRKTSSNFPLLLLDGPLASKDYFLFISFFVGCRLLK